MVPKELCWHEHQTAFDGGVAAGCGGGDVVTGTCNCIGTARIGGGGGV